MGNGPKVSGSGNVQTQSQPQPDDKTTTVQKGEQSLSDVARRLGVSAESLKQANPQLANANNLTAGREIKLPDPNQSKQSSQSQGKSQTAGGSTRDAEAAKAKAAEYKFANNLKAAELMKREAEFLKDGKITEDEAKQLKGGDKEYLKHMLEHDSFDPKARKIVEADIKQKVAVPKDSVSGQKIAMLGKDPVVVAKEFGPPEGFKTRYEALALARGADSKGAAIFQDEKTKRWHAVETNVPLGRGGNPSWSPEPKASHLEFVDKPDLAKWAEKRKIVDDLKAQGRTLNDYDLKAAYADMVATALGVPFTEVKIIDKSEEADPTKINFNPNLPAYGRAGAATLDGKPHTLQIGIGQLGSDQPFEVISTAFHEATHIRHHDRGNELLKQWEGIKGNKPPFDDWLKQQYRNHKITLEEKVTVLAEFRGNTSPTEAISYVNGFMATFAVDRKDDRMIASELGMAASKSPGDDDLKKELLSRLKNFYNGLDESDRTRFKAALAKAQNDNKGSWLGELKLP